jgi:hypothetical protein
MTVRDDLFTFLVAQEPWQQDLARRLVDRPQLLGTEYDEALLTVKGAFGALGEGERAPAVPPRRRA